MAGPRPTSAPGVGRVRRGGSAGSRGFPELQQPPAEAGARLHSSPKETACIQDPALAGQERRGAAPALDASASGSLLESAAHTHHHVHYHTPTQRKRPDSALTPSSPSRPRAPAGRVAGAGAGAWGGELLEALRQDLLEGVREEIWAGVGQLRSDIAEAVNQTVTEVRQGVQAEASTLAQSFARAANSDFSHVRQELRKLQSELQTLRGLQRCGLPSEEGAVDSPGTSRPPSARDSCPGSVEPGRGSRSRLSIAIQRPKEMLSTADDLRDIKAMLGTEASILEKVHSSNATLGGRLDDLRASVSELHRIASQTGPETLNPSSEARKQLSEDLSEVMGRLDEIESDGKQLRAKCEGDLSQIMIRMGSCHEQLLIELGRLARQQQPRRGSGTKAPSSGGVREGEPLPDGRATMGGGPEEANVPELTAGGDAPVGRAAAGSGSMAGG